LNGRDISNTQILVAGTTGSGKSNLLAVLLNEIRTLSIESPIQSTFYCSIIKVSFQTQPITWLQLFETERSAILDPILAPLTIYSI
jgi:DNA helicase HerA-like ATPase